MQVRPVTRKECEPFILGIHYAKRWPSISYAFGLFEQEKLIGVVCYGTPASATLKKGVAGEHYKGDILELNRLCLLDNLKNQASFLVGASLRSLPKNKIIVSFADSEQGHVGYVYQATNFIYCGLSAKRTDWKVKGKEHLHGQTIADEFRGVPNRAQAMRDKYGDDFYLAPRPRKHRYIFITGSKTFKRAATAALRYPIEPYPKKINQGIPMETKRVRRSAQPAYPPELYDVIYADPPWAYNDKSKNRGGAERHYETVDPAALVQMKPPAAKNSVLFMWATFPMLQEAITLMKEWGFEYRTLGFIWIKANTKATDSPFWGMGQWTRANAEICLMGVRGKPTRHGKGVHQLIVEPEIVTDPIMRHSQKPACVRDRIVELMGDVPRLEMFAREAPEGWAVFGNQAPGSIELLTKRKRRSEQ